MSGTTSFSLPEHFAWMIVCLAKTIAAEGHRRRMDGPLVVAIWNRVRRLGKRFAALVARWKAGTLRPPGAGRRQSGSPPPTFGPLHGPNPQGEGEIGMRTVSPRSPGLLPRGFAWLHRLMPQSVSGGVLCWLLQTPEMEELVAAAPVQAGRILRPLCHLLGLEPPPALMLPKRVRRKRPHPNPPPPESGRGRRKEVLLPPNFPDTPGARALARFAAGKPVDVTKLSSVAWGYIRHPPRDPPGLCPPREIGYARSRPRPRLRVRLPKDYDSGSKKWD